MTGREKTIVAVVVEDDSAQRLRLLQILQSDGDISVLGVAVDAADALATVSRVRADVVVVDLNLSDGSRVIEQLMAHNPTPILVLSSTIVDRDSPAAAEALVLGAVEAWPRPVRWSSEQGIELRHTLHQISRVAVIRHPRGGRTESNHRVGLPSSGSPVVAMAASTGGPTALASMLAALPGLRAPVLVVQHLHPEFTSGLLDWMKRVSALPVDMAKDGVVPVPGHVYLAPGGTHLRLSISRRLELHETPETLHRPSADQLFLSVAQQGSAAIGVLLTGMGEDGAKGLLAIRRSGGQTLAQDEASCAVFGMPRAAHRLGAVDHLLPLDKLPAAVQHAVRQAAS